MAGLGKLEWATCNATGTQTDSHGLGWRWVLGHVGQKGSLGELVIALTDMEAVCLVRQLINWRQCFW